MNTYTHTYTTLGQIFAQLSIVCASERKRENARVKGGGWERVAENDREGRSVLFIGFNVKLGPGFRSSRRFSVHSVVREKEKKKKEIKRNIYIHARTYGTLGGVSEGEKTYVFRVLAFDSRVRDLDTGSFDSGDSRVTIRRNSQRVLLSYEIARR